MNESKTSDTEGLENHPMSDIQSTMIDDINTRGGGNQRESENECFEETGNSNDGCMSVESIYIDDGCIKKKTLAKKPRRRPTKVRQFIILNKLIIEREVRMECQKVYKQG